MLKKLLVTAACTVCCSGQILTTPVQASSSGPGTKATSLSRTGKSARKNSQQILRFSAASTTNGGIASSAGHVRMVRKLSQRFLPSKPHNLAETMRLTAVMDDVAFFKLNTTDESVHLKAGNCYETVTVAQINPNEVVLEEKGLQYVKHLK